MLFSMLRNSTIMITGIQWNENCGWAKKVDQDESSAEDADCHSGVPFLLAEVLAHGLRVSGWSRL